MFKRRKIAFLIVAICVMMCACSEVKVPDNIQENAVVIDKSGSVTEYLVDIFDKDFYDLSELEKMVKEEAEIYNSENQLAGEAAPISVSKVTMLDQTSGKILVNRVFDRADTFSKVSGENFSFGTVASSRAQLERVGDGKVLHHVKKEETKQAADIVAMSEKHIVITDLKTLIYCPYTVEYISDGVSVREDGGVDTSGLSEGELAIIVMKK